jgi:hypothetical protein
LKITPEVLCTKPVGIGGSGFHPTNNPALIEEWLLSLHSNNLVRIKLRPSEFDV